MIDKYNTFKININGEEVDIDEIPDNQILHMRADDLKFFKKLYREKLNKTEKYKKIIEEVKKLTKRLFIEQPPCVVEIDCPYNGGVGFDNHCNEFCQIIIGKQVLDLINKMEGVECN